MPYYFTATSWIWNTAPILVFPILVLVVISVFYKLFFKRWPSFEVIILNFSISIIGLTTGFLSGFNESSAIESVLPAFLALMGIMIPYLLAKDSKKIKSVSAVASILSITILIGSQWGYNQAYASKVATRSKDYLIRQSELEAAIILERRKLNLSESLDVKPLPDDIIKK